MQPLNDGPRRGLDSAAIRTLVQGAPSVQVTYGAEWLDSNLALVDDITEFMTKGSTVASDCFATIHRTCSLKFDSNVPFDYVTDFVHPYVTLTNLNTGFSARFNLGVYTLQTPVFDNSTQPSVLTFTGYDLLYFLDQPIGDTFQMDIGSDPASVAAGLIGLAVPNAVVDYEDSGEVTTKPYTWPFDDQNQYTYLQVINALLHMVGYAPLWVDWDGAFQVHAFKDPVSAETEWDFNLLDNDNIVAEPRTSTQDFFSVPNYWRFVQNNLASAPIEGTNQITYVDNQTENPGSYPNRGRYVKKIQYVDATSFDKLWVQALQTIIIDLMPSEVFDVSTAPFPLAWHEDIFSYFDPNIEAIQPTNSALRRVQSVTWTISLDGADTVWTWQTINTTLSLMDSGSYGTGDSLELLPNASFESGNPPFQWYRSGLANAVFESKFGYATDGLYSGRIRCTTLVSTANFMQVGTWDPVSTDTGSTMQIQPNQKYQISVKVRVDPDSVSGDPGRLVGIYIDWWNGHGLTGTYISTGGDLTSATAVAEVPGQWVEIVRTVTAPATATNAEFYVNIYANGTTIPVGEAHLIDEVSVKAVA
jgi:hypothetical protein